MARSKQRMLVITALGVVFGDLGTSPLYTVQTIFGEPHGIEPLDSRLMGSLSMIFWTLTLIVSVKYVLIVMRADNDGEGGIMALSALVQRLRGRNTMLLVAFGVFGAALFYGDSMITPAVSVLSAVEGLEVVRPELVEWVLPITVGILILLFASQRLGTARVGAAFGPVMLVWFLVIAALGVNSIARTPEILASVDPRYAISLSVAEPWLSFLSLGSVILCVTGAEALYADMGHFGRSPIRRAWYLIAAPALYLNYLGQGALILREPSAVSRPFFLLAPVPMQLPLVILATVATVIASQAVISGCYSMTRQAMRLHYLPRLTVIHTSADKEGQIYIPAINWLLGISVVALVLGLKESSRLAGAYGLAVSGTFLITTVLITFVARHGWKTPLWLLVPVSALFVFIDASFFAANLTKLTHGAWFPLTVAIIFYVVLRTWGRGRQLLHEKRQQIGGSDKHLQALLEHWRTQRAPGTLVYVGLDARPPLALLESLERLHFAPEHSVQLQLRSRPVPKVAEEQQLTVHEVGSHFQRVTFDYGFMQRIDVLDAIDRAIEAGVDIPRQSTLVVYTSRIIPTGRGGMARWRKHLFAFMLRNAVDPTTFLRLPPERTLEVTGIVRL